MNEREKPVLIGQWFKSQKRDEKEKFKPTVFRDTLVQGLNEAGDDLEAVAKFLDSTGSRLDYRRYADTLFDILVAGSMLGKPCVVASSCRMFTFNSIEIFSHEVESL